MNGNAVIGASPMEPVRKDLQSSNLFPPKNEDFEKLAEKMVEKKMLGNPPLLNVSIFSPDGFIRDFLKGMLGYQGYACVKVADLQSTPWDLALHEHQVVFLDGSYLVGSESESIRAHVQQFIQVEGQVVVMANRPGDAALTAIQNTGGCQIVWKPLDYRQVGQVMAQM